MMSNINETSAVRFELIDADCYGGEAREHVSGRREPFVALTPDQQEEFGVEPAYELYAFSLRRREPDPNVPAVLVGERVWHRYRPRKQRRGVFLRTGGAVCMSSNVNRYAVVLHVRKWLMLLPLALVGVLLALALRTCGTTSQAPAPRYMDGQTQTEEVSTQPVASIEYASYEATMDSEWRANAIDQNFSLSLPAFSTPDGTTGKNPVDSSPSIYVDINADGDFEPDECVYNAPDSSGYGHLLRAGSRVDSIELTRPLDSGTYDAMTLWRSVLAGSSTPAGETAFAWTLTVS